MLLLADENVPVMSVEYLRARSLDVMHIAEVAPGASDVEVLAIAEEKRRVVITFDRDFGELIYQQQLRCSHGIILVRIVPLTPVEPGEILSKILSSGVAFEGRFTVVERDHIRQRPIPSA